MAKTWYPVIDYLTCTECGTCVAKCPHGVYDTAKAPSPVVLHPEGCVDHCHGCGNRCPAGAITYVGDDTGWTPPVGGAATEPACRCECEPAGKKVLVEYLYLDLETCDRCVGTDTVLERVMMTLVPALRLAGYEVAYKKIEMKTAELAARHRLLSSPTIRVNGRDVCGPVKENSCGCCGEISGTDVDCRIFEYNGELFEIPPEEMLADAVLKAVFGRGGEDGCCVGEYELPDNLKTFYEGKKKAGCSCNNGCCSK